MSDSILNYDGGLYLPDPEPRRPVGFMEELFGAAQPTSVPEASPMTPRSTFRMGLVAPHGTGKTTLAATIRTALETRLFQMNLSSLEVRQISFADPLRESIQNVPWPYTRDKYNKKLANERKLLQLTGETFRSFDNNWFLQRMLNQTQSELLDTTSSVWVIDDVYHFNEAAAMDLLFVIIPVSYYEKMKAQLKGDAPLDLSESERQLWQLLSHAHEHSNVLTHSNVPTFTNIPLFPTTIMHYLKEGEQHLSNSDTDIFIDKAASSIYDRLSLLN